MKKSLFILLLSFSFIGTIISQDSTITHQGEEPKTDTLKRIIRIGPCVSSINNEKPLYVIDGIPQDSVDVDEIIVSQIRKVKVMKYKKAIEKYDNKAKGGVILITTKRKRKTQ